MTSRSKGVLATSAVLIIVALAATLGVHGLQARKAEEIAKLPVVEMERIVIIGERESARPAGTQIVNTPTPALR
jgi:hypothetical protein